MTRGGLSLSLLVLLSASCSWFVEPRQERLRCLGSDAGVLGPDAGANPCPDGLSCFEGFCRECASEETDCNDGIDNDCNGLTDRAEIEQQDRELCDQLDNDCDDKIDEGFDQDGDQRFVCGSKANGTPPDCDDTNAERFPGNPEVCDGLDNDCSKGPDDVPAGKTSLCDPGERCEPREATCIKPTCDNDPALACDRTKQFCDQGVCKELPAGCMPACPLGQVCRDNRCQERPKVANGGTCTLDVDCLSGVCVDAVALRVAPAGKICAQACCSDATCRQGERCIASGTGARSCLPAEGLQQPERCTRADQCEPRNECALANESRVPGQPTDLTTTVCRAPRDAQKLGEFCNPVMPSSCSTSVCVPGPFAASICSVPCGRSSDCVAFGNAAPSFPRPTSYCRYVRVFAGSDAGRPPDYASVCVIARPEGGDGEHGASCDDPADCRERGCIGATEGRPGYCLATCCDDSQCTGAGRTGFCRPFKVGMGYEMRCDSSNLR